MFFFWTFILMIFFLILKNFNALKQFLFIFSFYMELIVINSFMNICVYVCACVYICNIHTHTYIHTYIHMINTYIHIACAPSIHTCIRVAKLPYIYTYIFTLQCIYLCKYVLREHAPTLSVLR